MVRRWKKNSPNTDVVLLGGAGKFGDISTPKPALEIAQTHSFPLISISSTCDNSKWFNFHF
jgi:hypothetical protein